MHLSNSTVFKAALGRPEYFFKSFKAFLNIEYLKVLIVNILDIYKLFKLFLSFSVSSDGFSIVFYIVFLRRKQISH
jgi:hypothetical protein